MTSIANTASGSRSSNKVAIVTGASRGIGAAIARRLAADGIAVIINYAGRKADADAVVAGIEAAGGRAAAVQADVAIPAQVAAMVDQACTLFGGVDFLVNNAGIIQPGLTMLADTDDELFDRLIAINLKGSFNTMRIAAKRLRDGGRIVNFSSSVKALALPGYSVYAGTKAAVEAMTNIFAKELRGRDITVNAVAPGPTATDLFLKDKTEAQIEHLAKLPPLERLAQPDDIAEVVAFLVSPAGGWINGQTIRANGGMV
ncbi:SDR family oxidoreductase [Herbaspirillum frisingense]|uniref:SDR family oxidoreductase n=1 Tax=Herbaspirillum frisingense TaxID=92645 RepID=UPI00160105EA|nr:SDR family oxidoreductase [Herbaspirillum frisingense]QNB08856.1 SDR family oxidoreductase [Herbaspirillum frisingense]